MLRQVAPRSMIPWLPRETYNVRTALPFVTSIGHDHSAEALRDQVETLLRPQLGSLTGVRLRRAE